MFNYIWPIVLIVASNVFYNISTKSTPNQMNPFASLVITYLVGAMTTLVLFFITSENKNFLLEMKNVNWTCLILGLSIVGLEAGYIYMYRAGWNISMGSVVSNIILAIALILVGIFAYKEHMTLNKIFGIALCVLGLVFINKK